ncbi:uncharacterized protein LOC133718917 [Rosa rugosa]|uniref:uncharacterized protein LOC133718917 n=1 Tax=Rosa rugosa TaxID=74645 RepID=UPI002B400AB7|nr:uncharacterized protein LOC133718917 [Rosa rugosa]
MDSQELTTRVRLVRCPRCRLLLPELPDFKVYKCGGCGAVLRARNRVRNERRSEGLTIQSAPVNQLLDHVSRDSESVSSVASMGEVRTRNQVRNERSEGLIIETAPVNELLDHVSREK